MKYTILFIFLCLAFTLAAQAQTQTSNALLTQDRAEAFIRTLIFDRPSLDRFIDPNDLESSNRLRIQYVGVDWKILIGHDIDENIREKIKSKELGYSFVIRPLQSPYSKLLFATSDSLFKQVFFFKNDMMISPLTYFTRNMYRFNRSHVTFYTSDPSLLSDYSMNRVSTFIRDNSQVIGNFTASKSQTEWLNYEDASWRHFYGIRLNPLIYIVCKDAHQIEQITGYNTLGLSDLSMDAVISTSNSHFHEIIHLLMNFNLQPIPLYTHPLLQEGIATYFGGRGGKSAEVMLQTADWLRNMNIIPLDTLLATESFKQQDASISYPLSALICSRYISQYGMKQFTKLYKKYSSSENFIRQMTIQDKDLDLHKLFSQPAGYSYAEPVITCKDITKTQRDIKFPIKPKYSSDSLTVWSGKSSITGKIYWKFTGMGTFLSRADNSSAQTTGHYRGYKSRIFMEKFPGEVYHKEHYLLIITESEISLYDLYIDQLIAFYSNEFVQKDQQIQTAHGKVTFYLNPDNSKFQFKPVK